MDNTHMRFTVHELSEISGIPARTIRYYNQIGLFNHSGTMENGYRFFKIEKIEEIHLISYLRHIGVSIGDIKRHLANRDIDQYDQILQGQLDKISGEIEHLKAVEGRIRKRISALEYIRAIPAMNTIMIREFPARPILRLDTPVNQPIDWERQLLDLEKRGNLPPSLFIGDPGFLVDLKKTVKRGPTEFSGMFLFADDPFFSESELREELPAGSWLFVFLRGDHSAAAPWYGRIAAHARTRGLKTGDFGLERTLIDHYISSDPDLYITEIQVPLASS